VVQKQLHSGTLRAMSKLAHIKTVDAKRLEGSTDRSAVDLPGAPASAPAESDRDSRVTEQSGSHGTDSREIGGPSGPEPTRFGDWERKGRCIDF